MSVHSDDLVPAHGMADNTEIDSKSTTGQDTTEIFDGKFERKQKI